MLVPQADFLELKRYKLFFLNFGGASKIVYNIDTASTNVRMNFGAAGKFFYKLMSKKGPQK
jgi:hypothetical protein